MKTTKLALFVCVFFSTITIYAQNLELGKQDSIVKKSWIVGVGFNAVDDAGSEFTNLFNVSDNWNIVPYPSRISIGRYFESGIGLEAIASYNRYEEGKIVDDVINTEEIDYYGFDFNVNYDLNKIIGETGFFDPYIALGAGYTDANNQGRVTANTAVGARFWINDRLGVDANSKGKWAVSSDEATNHIQHAVGLVYRFGVEKGLSKKGEEKLAQIQEFEKEQQRVQDSINLAQEQERKAKELAALIEKEKEQARIAAAAKEQRIAEEAKAKKDAILSKISELGYVYFDLNSSYLKEGHKRQLDELAELLKANPSITIKIGGYADSRGTDKYNLWLSERRVDKTIAYLASVGIGANRLKKQAYGESVLLNDCDDSKNCPEVKHSENRRSDFVIISND